MSKNELQAPSPSPPGKMRIDPLQLLQTLSILLNKNGGIKSLDEVKRVAGLMGKYSKKLVSKCVYLNILEATDSPLLDQFYQENGWNLVGNWLAEAIKSKNWPLSLQILNLLLQSPVTVDRLKLNDSPKLVKELSKECSIMEVKATAEKIIQKWKEVVQSLSVPVTNIEVKNDHVQPQNLNFQKQNENISESAQVEKSEEILSNNTANNNTAAANNNNNGSSPEQMVVNVQVNVEPESVITDYTSRRKAPVTRVPRGGRTKRGRGRQKLEPDEAPSYADLLTQELGEADPTPSEDKPSQETEPLKITIRNGNKIVRPKKKLAKQVLVADEEEDSSSSQLTKDKVDGTSAKDSISTKQKDGSSEITSDTTVKEKENLPSDDDLFIRKSTRPKKKTKKILSMEEIEDDDDTDEENEKLLFKVKNKKISKIEESKDTTPARAKEKDEKMSSDDDSFFIRKSSSDKENLLVIKSSDEDGTESDGGNKQRSSPKLSKKDDVKKQKSKAVGDNKEKDKNKQIDKDKPKDNMDKEKEKLKDKNRDKDKSYHKDKNDHKDRHKDKERDRHKDRHRNKDKHKDRHRDKRERHRDKHKDKKSSHSNKSEREEKISKEEKDSKSKGNQSEVDKATLDKVKPLSTDGLAKIPRKPASFLDALSAGDADSDIRKPAVKTKSRGFRSTGLDEPIAKPGTAGKRLLDNASSNNPKKLRPAELQLGDKRVKPSVSSDPVSGDRPGGVKLTSPKRPSLADDGGFMAALTAAGTDRKKIPRKRRPSDADKMEGNKVQKTDDKEPDPSSSPKELKEEDKDENKIMSPTTVKPSLNFYKETLKDEVHVEKTEINDEEVVKPSEDESSEDPIKIEKEETKEVSETVENGEKENILAAPAAPAPVNEDYERIEVFDASPSHKMKGVLVYHRSLNRIKKKLKWKSEDSLTQTFFFPMDETERVNVNTLKFQEMMQREKASEKELLGKHRNKFMSMGEIIDNVSDFMPWKLYPILLTTPVPVIPGDKSKEKHIQAQRELTTMEAFFHPSMRPETPSEPDAELITRTEPKVIPLNDISGSDTIMDHRHIPWPDPVMEMPIIHHNQPMDGGRWVIGSHPGPRGFAPGMFPGPRGPPGGPPNFMPQNFGPDIRGQMGPNMPPGNWGPPNNDFNNPGMMQMRPNMGMGGNMNNPMGPNMGNNPMGPNMGNNPMGPNMGNNPMGPNMNNSQMGPNMGNNPMGPNLGNMQSNPVGNASGPMRGGMRFRGNWGKPPGGRPCKHFLNGHCRNGNNCRFSHSR